MPDFVLQPRRLCSGTSRTDVHVIPAAHRPLLLRNFHGVQVGDLALDHLDGLVLIDASDVHGHQDVALGLHELRQNAVVDLRGGDLQKADSPVHLADAEGAGLPEVAVRHLAQ